jgi:hypothetical protein
MNKLYFVRHICGPPKSRKSRKVHKGPCEVIAVAALLEPCNSEWKGDCTAVLSGKAERGLANV